SQTGRAVVVYDDVAGGTGLNYRVWDGASWGAGQTVSAPASVTDDPSTIALAADPTSNRIALRTLTKAGEGWLSVWGGGSRGSSLLASSATTSATDPVAAVAFESQSGDLVATYSESTNQVRYRTWTSSGGWSSELNGPDIGSTQTPNTMSLTADPYSNEIMLA